MLKEICVFVEKRNNETSEWDLVKQGNPRITDLQKHINSSKQMELTEASALSQVRMESLKNGYAFELAKERAYESLIEEAKDVKPTDCLITLNTLDQLCDRAAPEIAEWLSLEEFDYPAIHAILANISVESGIENVAPGHTFKPVSESKGIPMDASDDYLKFVLMYMRGSMAHTYHSLKELKEYDWSSQLDYDTLYLDEAGNDYLSTKLPENGRFVNKEEMNELLLHPERKENNIVYFTEETRLVPMTECDCSFPRFMLPQLEELSETETGEDIRILLFFA